MKRSDDLLAGLDDIDWAALEHAYGSAEDVPGQLRSVCGPDEEARESAFRSLFGNIFHQGTRYSASPYAVPFLTRIAVAGPADARVDALLLLTRLAIDWHDEHDLPLGIDTAAWRAAAISPEDNLRWYDEQIAAETDEEQLERLRQGRAYCAAGHPVDGREGALRSYDAVRAQLPVLLELLGDRDPEIRTKTAYLLGWFPEEADATLHPLLACLDGERDPVCVATILIAVGLLADHDPDGRLRHYLDHEHPLPRWAAATALTRLLVAHPAAAPGLPPAERIAAELAAFGAGPAPESATAHHAGDLHSYTVRSLLHLMGAAEDPEGVLLDIVRALPRIKETGVVHRPLAVRAENLLKALFDPTDAVPVFTELSPGRQKLLKVLAELLTAADFQSVPFGSDLHERFTQYGLPGTLPALRAYVGMSTEGEDPTAPSPIPGNHSATTEHFQRDHLSGDSSGASGVKHLPGMQSVESVGHAVHPAVGSLISLTEGGSCFFALHKEVPVVLARHPGHVSDRDDGRFAVCGPSTRSDDCHVRRAQQVSGTVPDHGCLGPFRREGTQDTSPPDVAGGDKDETEHYEQESAWDVRSHLSSLHHSHGDRHARVCGTRPPRRRAAGPELSLPAGGVEAAEYRGWVRAPEHVRPVGGVDYDQVVTERLEPTATSVVREVLGERRPSG